MKDESKLSPPEFDYNQIPEGYYDEVLQTGSPIRKAWHLNKFERVFDCLPQKTGLSLLDIGCFSGTFLSMIPTDRFSRQLGVDILPQQIEYAKKKFGNPQRNFRHIPTLSDLNQISETFDCVTLIEVIEHLRPDEIWVVFEQVARLLKPGGLLTLSTPNYLSFWPLIEFLLNHVSEISYEEQHITKFHFFNFEKKLKKIFPEFDRYFSVSFKTTTHFMTPFLAGLHFSGARKLSKTIPHHRWRFPFGNLVLLGLERKA